MNPNQNKTALVTGASGGIGESLARQLAANGYALVLVARSRNKLEEIASQLKQQHNTNTVVIETDLSLPNATEQLVQEIKNQNLHINLLVNNAGIGSYGLFHQLDAGEQQRILMLNIVALTMLTRALLPDMVARGAGKIMNVASTAAFMPGPLMAVYYASKAYVLSFSEALSEELIGTGVTVTTLCPGPTTTDFQVRAEMTESKLVRGKNLMTSNEVAMLGVAAMERGQRIVIPGAMNQLQAFSPRIVPRALMPKIVKRIQEK